MNGPEIHPAVEASNVQARTAAREAQAKVLWSIHKRKVTIRFLVRETLLVLGILVSWVAMDANLIDWRIVFSLTCLLMFCIGTLFGEWRQFVTRKGGK